MTNGSRTAIIMHTNNVQLNHLKTLSSETNDANLSALFGNLAAALMTVGAYRGASALKPNTKTKKFTSYLSK